MLVTRIFCPFPQCLKRLLSQGRQQLDQVAKGYAFPKQALVFKGLQDKSFENTVGKGEIAHKEKFLLFQWCFLPALRTLLLPSNLRLLFANSFSLEESKTCHLGKG